MSSYRSVSVATIVRGRQDHFDHLIAGLAAQNFVAEELVVAHMQADPPSVRRDLPFPVNFVQVGGEELPLAAARNAAAIAASGDILAFLDVDCIPDPEFVRRASEICSIDSSGVFLPEVRYLAANATGWLEPATGTPAYEALVQNGVRHDAKPDLADIDHRRIDDYGELWGLAFIMERASWFKAHGMDEAYFGYGAEETDFAQRLREAALGLYWLGGTICFHQHHAVHIPPLQHFDSIVRNARLFYDRWGGWCMNYWLDAFDEAGLIRRGPGHIEVLRHPTVAEIAASAQGPGVRFS